VWRFEDYVRAPEAVTSRLLGIPLPPGGTVAPSARTRTPSAEAIRRIEALGIGLPYREHLAAAERILARDPPGAERYAPLSPDQRRRLAEADVEDLDGVSGWRPVRLSGRPFE
jgi:hypothetical protein